MKGSIFILIAALLIGCSKPGAENESKKQVIFSIIPPVCELAATIGMDSEDVLFETLIGPGETPHSYEPTARELEKLAEAKLLITVGLPFERALLKKIKTLYPDLQIIHSAKDVERRSETHSHNGVACQHIHGATDPHVWLSIPNLKIMANEIYEALCLITPEERENLARNHDNLQRGLSYNDDLITKLLAPHKNHSFYVYHPSFGYFAAQHHLNQIPIELDGKTPSSRQLSKLIESAKKDEIKTLFVQQQFPKEAARIIANSINGKVVQVNPLAKDPVETLLIIARAISSEE